MNSIKKLAGFLGVVGISSLLTLPGLAEVNLNQSAKNSLLLAQNSPGQSTSNPTNNRGSSGSTGVNAVDDPCVRQGTRGDGGSLSSSANSRNSSTNANRRTSSNSDNARNSSRSSSNSTNARNSSGSTSYPSGDDQSLTAQNQRCLEQENDNSSSDSDSTTTPGMRNTPGGSTISPGTRNTPGSSTTTPGSGI
ncbi:hypothetical protein ACE1CI_24945 [Aerosakkonemataceae cyanobacterium BLCC-F50]|uniref:Uncharacterized protein n=1 Tax=Floridaenema flaviceps BLCC-F50 TaxID=3153642 RepID=A0ABV4XXJ0_9CYAN